MQGDVHDFKIGQLYKRQLDLHDVYGGQRQGGISTPRQSRVIFLFTGDAGTAYGYRDEFNPEGVFLYTGEGQQGDMGLTRGNAAIEQHKDNGRLLLVFEDIGGGSVRFMGEADYLGHHLEPRLDRDQNLRNALIFHLGIRHLLAKEDAERPEAATNLARESNRRKRLLDLRKKAIAPIEEPLSPNKKIVEIRERAEAIRQYALGRAAGKCRGCAQRAPFKGRNGLFLEVHHLRRLADGGPDHPENVIALCPNCHRKAHYSIDADEFNAMLIEWVRCYERAIR